MQSQQLPDQTLASIVTHNSSAARIFENFSLDFCCKGKRTLSEACKEKGLDINQVMAAIEWQSSRDYSAGRDFSAFSCEQIIGYILLHHHFYVRQAMPSIQAHLKKVCTKHGTRFPYMLEVSELFQQIRAEMEPHMMKEETILFPHIKAMEKAEIDPDSFIAAPIEIMMQEHEQTGELLERIREITNGYTIPEGACTTFTLLLNELRQFEEDMHKHVHLENYILFPKVITMLASTN
jgi:regulator of cell morphogenesis and NO signaling